MIMDKVQAYRGEGSYIFVSYAHANSDIVFPFISVLQQKYNVWFDEGIHFGREWDEEIMAKIENCSLFLFVVTKESLVSANCKDELAQARDLKKPFINILAERSMDDELPPYFKLRYSRYQKCYLDSYGSYEEAAESLAEKCEAFEFVKKTEAKKKEKLLCEVNVRHACLISTDLELEGKECPPEFVGMVGHKTFSSMEEVPAHYTPCIEVSLTNISDADITIAESSPVIHGELNLPHGEQYSAIGMQLCEHARDICLTPGTKKTFSLVGMYAIIAMGAFHNEGGFIQVDTNLAEPMIFQISEQKQAIDYARNIVSRDYKTLIKNFQKYFLNNL